VSWSRTPRTKREWEDSELPHDDSLIQLDLLVMELCARRCGEPAHVRGQHRHVPDLLGDEKFAWKSLEKLGADPYDDIG
jgi:hypothetical protein